MNTKTFVVSTLTFLILSSSFVKLTSYKKNTKNSNEFLNSELSHEKRQSKSMISNQQNDKTALFIIDMQKQYLDPNFPGYVPNTEKLPNKINEIRQHFRETLKTNYIEIFTVDCLMKNSNCLLTKDEIKISNTLIQHSEFQRIKRIPIHPNQDISEEALFKLIPDLSISNLFILEKAGERAEYSAFGETWEGKNKYGKGKDYSIANRILQAHKVKNVYVVGLAYQQCVLYTAADAAFLKYRTFIVENATNSSVFIKDRVKAKSFDAENFKRQLYENERVDFIVNNKFNGLPKADDEVLKIVKFTGKGFVEK